MSWLRSEGAFRSGGDTCAAWVYRPAVSPAAKAPVIVMAHGFGCVRALQALHKLKAPEFAELKKKFTAPDTWAKAPWAPAVKTAVDACAFLSE